MLVHGFPEFWWAWRAQIPALAAAGYRVAAVDLRGFGASDKPPSGYDAPTACDDLAAVIRSLGASRAAIVGHGLGAWFTWSMPALRPEVTGAIATFSMPHPLVFQRAAWRHPLQWRANTYIRAMQTPFAPERQLSSRRHAVARRLRDWSGPDRSWITDEVLTRYEQSMQVPFVATAATEYYRWLYRTRVTLPGWRYLASVRAPIEVPTLLVHGADDPAVLPALAAESHGHVRGPVQVVTVPGAGHFVPEEAPAATTELLLGWLSAYHPA